MADYLRLLGLPDEEFRRVDPVAMNLLVAKSIPALADLDIPRYQRLADEWADAVRERLTGAERVFWQTPEDWRNDINFFRLGVLCEFLEYDAGIAYNEEQRNATSIRYTNPSDLFLNGVMDTRRGTCGNMAALHVAIGRRLGWPVSLACVKSHYICRYDDGRVAHNIKATQAGYGGFGSDTDDCYVARYNLPPVAIRSGSDLTALSAQQVLGVFVGFRARHMRTPAAMRRPNSTTCSPAGCSRTAGSCTASRWGWPCHAGRRCSNRARSVRPRAWPRRWRYSPAGRWRPRWPIRPRFGAWSTRRFTNGGCAMVRVNGAEREDATEREARLDALPWYIRAVAGQGPLGFKAGDANLYRYVGNSPTNMVDPSGLTGVGHHWVSSCVVDDAAIRPHISDEAYHLQQGSYSGVTRDAAGKGHQFGTYGGVTHARYNDIVKAELKAYIRVNKIQKMTSAQMDDFVSKIQSGKDHAGKPNKELKAFNDEIRRQTQAHIDHCKKNGTQGGLQKAQTPEQRIKQGQSYMKRADYIKLKVGAAVAVVMGAFVSEAKGAIEVAADSPNFKNAVGALSRGDVAGADRSMLGPGEARGSYCFQADLIDKGYPLAATQLEHHWSEALKKAQERAEEAAKPHDKIPAPPLPAPPGFIRRQWDWLTDW